jgi:hypothetical protein
MDLDHDDYKVGDVFKDCQQIVLDTAHKIVVSMHLRQYFRQPLIEATGIKQAK